MKQNVKKIAKTATAKIVIQSSPDGKNDWVNLMPADTPEYVKNKGNLGRLIDGEMVCFDPSSNHRWYRAFKIDDLLEDKSIKAALDITKGV